ncbi:hypothetical protein OXX79_014490, partial [Metschnikowia pulcherrima]
VRQTQVYKDIGNVIDDGSSTAYGGFLTKEQRELLRKQELEKRLKDGKGWKPVKENEDAGGALVATDSKPTGPSVGQRWEEFKLRSPNGLISLVRTIVEKITGFFSETEQAQVVKQFRMMDPTFRVTDFTRTLTNYIVPELLDAYI